MLGSRAICTRDKAEQAQGHRTRMRTVDYVISQRVVGDRVADLEERCYVSSHELTRAKLGSAVRAH